MANNFPDEQYRKRWKIESIFSAMKRKFGGYLKSTSLSCQLTEVVMKAIAYNIERLGKIYSESKSNFNFLWDIFLLRILFFI